MAQLPSDYTPVPLGEISRSEKILSLTYKDLSKNLNWLWNRKGHKIGGIIFDPAYVDTGASFWSSVSNDSNTIRQMLHFQPSWKFQKPYWNENTGKIAYRLTVAFFGKDIKVRVLLTQSDSGGYGAQTFHTFEIGNEWAWKIGTIQVTLAGTVPEPDRAYKVNLSTQKREDEGDNGQVLQVALFEGMDFTSSELPQGEPDQQEE